MDLSNYIGQIASLKEEFLTLMPLTSDVGAQQTQVDKFFMVLTLIGLRPDLETLRDHILGSPSVPSLDDVFARLLRISSTQTLSSDSPLDSSVLVSHTNLRGGRSGTQGRGQRPHCTYCNKLGHTRDRCYQLHCTYFFFSLHNSQQVSKIVSHLKKVLKIIYFLVSLYDN